MSVRPPTVTVAGVPSAFAPPSAIREVCRAIEAEVAAFFGVAASDIRSPTRRSRAAANARQCAMYLAHTMLGQSYRAVGELFGRDRTTASYACRRIEDWRDNPMTEALMAALEERCAAAIRQWATAQAATAQVQP